MLLRRFIDARKFNRNVLVRTLLRQCIALQDPLTALEPNLMANFLLGGKNLLFGTKAKTIEPNASNGTSYGFQCRAVQS